MKEKIFILIKETLEEINEELEVASLKSINTETKLYGGDAALDSLALVSLIADLEDRISDELDIDIVLADEKAMSQRTSPFRTVESLTNYIVSLLKEDNV